LIALAAGALNWIGCRVSPPLNAARRATLEAVLERLIPSDDLGPGAREAGAMDYIESALATRYHAGLRGPFRRFCDLVERTARDDWQQGFAEMEPLEQDRLLARVQGMDATFEKVLELTLEGFLCDPVHGGNRDRVGWKFIGFDTKRCGS
jgi:gluconate 2-dehydrogenase gamma chain